jgi:hypothetical protein
MESYQQASKRLKGRLSHAVGRWAGGRGARLKAEGLGGLETGGKRAGGHELRGPKTTVCGPKRGPKASAYSVGLNVFAIYLMVLFYKILIKIYIKLIVF